MKRVWIALLAVVLLLVTAPTEKAVSAFLWQQGNEAESRIVELQEKYDIQIELDAGTNQALDENSLTTLDLALENVTPKLVRHVSACYRERTGSPLTFRYRSMTRLADPESEGILAGFQPEKALIELYLPTADYPVLATGENPISIVHEFGHALHFLLAEQYGMEYMEQEWVAFNGELAYDASHISANPDDTTFITGYAATMYEEDVAETIGHVFVRYRPGQGFIGRLSVDGKLTGLGRKVAYIEQILSDLVQAEDALLNYCRMYSAESAASYRRMSFSGDYLQFAGYPPPRYVLQAVLAELGYAAEREIWVEEIGAWHVTNHTGSELIVFPGGTWCEVEDWPLEFLAVTPDSIVK